MSQATSIILPGTPDIVVPDSVVGAMEPREVGARVIDTSRGTSNHKVSSQFWNRPADQRFLSLTDLYEHCKKARDESFANVFNVKDVEVRAQRDEPDSMRLIIPDQSVADKHHEVEPTHWSFGQICSLVQVPASYLRKLPGSLAGINLQYGLSTFREEAVKGYIRENGKTELRAANGVDYGRIFDDELVSSVMRFAGDGTGSAGWKVPGLLDWGTMKYDPYAPNSKETTTLFASDRDVFIFLVDDLHPIRIGTLAGGEPDYVFRGFMAWNSEVGSKRIGVAAMYLRGSCCNRILWGVEGYTEIELRHSKNAPMRFAGEVLPALESFTSGSSERLVLGVKAAREAIVAKTDEDAVEFLGKEGFTKPETKAIIERVLDEEQHPARSVWDFVQGITAFARREQHQDDRVALERKAGRLLDKVTS